MVFELRILNGFDFKWLYFVDLHLRWLESEKKLRDIKATLLLFVIEITTASAAKLSKLKLTQWNRLKTALTTAY